MEIFFLVEIEIDHGSAQLPEARLRVDREPELLLSAV
jgi:hypothetical protein